MFNVGGLAIRHQPQKNGMKRPATTGRSARPKINTNWRAEAAQVEKNLRRRQSQVTETAYGFSATDLRRRMSQVENRIQEQKVAWDQEQSLRIIDSRKVNAFTSNSHNESSRSARHYTSAARTKAEAAERHQEEELENRKRLEQEQAFIKANNSEREMINRQIQREMESAHSLKEQQEKEKLIQQVKDNALKLKQEKKSQSKARGKQNNVEEEEDEGTVWKRRAQKRNRHVNFSKVQSHKPAKSTIIAGPLVKQLPTSNAQRAGKKLHPDGLRYLERLGIRDKQMKFYFG